jgi:hypothetical protein
VGTPDRGEHIIGKKSPNSFKPAFSPVLLLFTAMLIVVFGQMRPDRTTGYSAIFLQHQWVSTGHCPSLRR